MTALEYFVNGTYRGFSSFSIRERYGRALHLSEEGVARFAGIGGWLTGLRAAGMTEEAATLADQFDETVHLLMHGTDPVDMLSDGMAVKAPRMKVMLYGGDCLHSFGFCKHYAHTNDKRLATARGYDEEAYSNIDLPEEQARYRWADALRKADRALALRRELEEIRYGEHGTSTVVHYGAGMVGGVIYHGAGAGETFTVRIGNSKNPWSINT